MKKKKLPSSFINEMNNVAGVGDSWWEPVVGIALIVV